MTQQIPPYQPPPPPQQPGVGYGGYQPASKGQGMAIASMVLGILSILTFCVWWLAVPLGVIAIILALVARGQIARGEAEGGGMAKAGLITGIIGTLLSILITVLAIVGVSMFGDKMRQELERQQQLQQQQQSSPGGGAGGTSDTTPNTDTTPADTGSDTGTGTGAQPEPGKGGSSMNEVEPGDGGTRHTVA